MITPDARLSIRTLSLASIQVCQYEERYVETLLSSIALMKAHPDHYAGVLVVEPSHTHVDMFSLLDGHTRFAASSMAGRRDAPCVVVEEAVAV